MAQVFKHALGGLVLLIILVLPAIACTTIESGQASGENPHGAGNVSGTNEGAGDSAAPLDVPATVSAMLTRAAPTPAPTPDIPATVAVELTRLAPPTPAPGLAAPLVMYSISDLVEDIEDGLVQILTPDASGSGFAVSDEGLIVTNAHLVKDHRFVTVRSVGGASYAGVVRGKDEELDLAVIKVESLGGIKAIPLGDVSEVRPGDPVFTMGFPLRDQLGDGYTITTGVVSSLRSSGSIERIQTDAAINAGSSGGPLVNGNGEVIGVNSATFREHVGISLAVSIQEVKDNLLALSAGHNVPVHAKVKFNDYFNEECHYSLRIPSGWQDTGDGDGCGTSWVKYEEGAQVGGIRVWDYPLSNGETLEDFADWWRGAMEDRAGEWRDYAPIYSGKSTVERDGIRQAQYVMQYNWQQTEEHCVSSATDTIAVNHELRTALVFSVSVCEFVPAPVFHEVASATIAVGGPAPVSRPNATP